MSEIDQNFKAEIEAKLSAAAEDLQLPFDVFMEIVNESMGPTKDDIVALEQTIVGNDYEAIQSASHKLKGTFGNLRLDHLVSDTARINDLSKQATGIEEIKTIFPTLKENFEKFTKAIAS